LATGALLGGALGLLGAQLGLRGLALAAGRFLFARDLQRAGAAGALLGGEAAAAAVLGLRLNRRRDRLAVRGLSLAGRLGHLRHASRRAALEGPAALDLDGHRLGAAVAEALAHLARLD